MGTYSTPKLSSMFKCVVWRTIFLCTYSITNAEMDHMRLSIGQFSYVITAVCCFVGRSNYVVKRTIFLCIYSSSKANDRNKCVVNRTIFLCKSNCVNVVRTINGTVRQGLQLSIVYVLIYNVL